MAIEHGTVDGYRYLGSTAINRVYFGSTLVYGEAPAGGIYSWTRSADVYDISGNGSSQITITFNTNGTCSYSSSSGDAAAITNDMSHWHDGGTVAGIGNSRWIKKTSSGDTTSGTLTTALVALSSSRTLSISTIAGEARQGNDLLEIYSDSGGTTKVGQIDLTITAVL